MPDYNTKDQRGQAIPPKPRDKDEAAKAFDDNERAAIERNKEAGRKHEADQKTRAQETENQKNQDRDTAGKRAKAREQERPPERFYGRDRFTEGQTQNVAQPAKREVTEAQQKMKDAREDARRIDQEVAAGKRDPPTRTPPENDRSR